MTVEPTLVVLFRRPGPVVLGALIERLNLGAIGNENIGREKNSSEKISQCAAR